MYQHYALTSSSSKGNAGDMSLLVVGGTLTMERGGFTQTESPTSYGAQTSWSDGHALLFPFSWTWYTWIAQQYHYLRECKHIGNVFEHPIPPGTTWTIYC